MAQPPPQVQELIQRFERNRDAYRSPHYNETQVRREFLDPLFKALGWDIDNEQGYAEAYKDVVHEDAIKVGEATKAPDYCFRIGGTRKFFLEAKRPSVDIKHDASPAFQLRRYAWTTKLPLSILSDFEEFAVYDCRFPIRQVDPSNAADKSRRDQVARLAEQMLALHQSMSAARTPQEQTALERQIAAADTQIDRLVYELYGLTEEEIKLVERATA
jgi:predicted type IV restriction endonuclease